LSFPTKRLSPKTNIQTICLKGRILNFLKTFVSEPILPHQNIVVFHILQAKPGRLYNRPELNLKHRLESLFSKDYLYVWVRDSSFVQMYTLTDAKSHSCRPSEYKIWENLLFSTYCIHDLFALNSCIHTL
jgi:hypothetical protein